MSDLQRLQTNAKGFSILYVEDNSALRKNAAKLLSKFFTHVDVAEDGKIGLELFRKHHYSIVLTDIKMPHMDGMSLSKYIKKIHPPTKVIIMSAFDDKELLLEGIELGIFSFLKKPVNVTELSTVLHRAILEIKHEYNTKVFYAHLKDVFDYQSSMVVMLNDTKITLANDKFLDFFEYESLEDCRVCLHDIGEKFLEHDGFLYNDETSNAIETLKMNEQKLYHVKLKNRDSEIRHFILKYKNVPEKARYGILSFEDVTELNLLKLFDANKDTQDRAIQDHKSMMNLLQVIQKNSAKIELHNYYKGLSVTNCGVITKIEKDQVTIKTTYMQQKTVQIENKLLLLSSALPYAIESNEILKINFEKQEIVIKSLKFMKTSPITRATIRVVPDKTTNVSLFLGENKFSGDAVIEDISLGAVKLKLNAIPAGLDKESDIILDIVLELDKKPLIINTKATLYKKTESGHNFYVVFIFKELKKSNLVKYITKRQMALIRELKGMQNG